MRSVIEAVERKFGLIRANKPLVHHLTNYVTANDCANMAIAIGAAPVMADCLDEAAEMAGQAQAVVINIGTLNQMTFESMLLAGKKANDLGVPAVLDPVGAGATAFRADCAARLLEEISFSVIRGNQAEIVFLGGGEGRPRGVDSEMPDDDEGFSIAVNCARRLAGERRTVVVASGARDIVCDEEKTLVLENGHPEMTLVSGAGCMSATLIGAFCGAEPQDYFAAAVGGQLTMGLCGELAFVQTGDRQPGAYRAALLNAAGRLDEHVYARWSRIYAL